MRFLYELKTKLLCKKIGSDEFGNCYYESNKGIRSVIYKGIAEPSKIPAEWHGWIHYTTDLIPIHTNTRKYSWQKIHTPNLTGTKNSYIPKNTVSNYEAWSPPKSKTNQS